MQDHLHRTLKGKIRFLWQAQEQLKYKRHLEDRPLHSGQYLSLLLSLLDHFSPTHLDNTSTMRLFED